MEDSQKEFGRIEGLFPIAPFGTQERKGNNPMKCFLMA
jgi:hypothetical protein